jgi:hypothetical protein
MLLLCPFPVDIVFVPINSWNKEFHMNEKLVSVYDMDQHVNQTEVRSHTSQLEIEAEIGLEITKSENPNESDDEVTEREIRLLNSEPYKFPEAEITGSHSSYSLLAHEELVSELTELALNLEMGIDGPAYSDVRDEVCAIQIELNRRKRLAPRFRPSITPPRKPKTDDDVMLSRDRQFIDLHWLHCIGWKKRLWGCNAVFERLLARANFRADLVERFVLVPVKADTKATWLGLPDPVAFQLVSIQTGQIRDRYRVAVNGDLREGKINELGAAQIATILENAVRGKPHLGRHVETWVGIWLAGKLVGEHADTLRQFYALMVGAEKLLDRRDIARRYQTIKEHVQASKKSKGIAKKTLGENSGE